MMWLSDNTNISFTSYVNGFVQDYSNSIAKALELL